MSKISDLTVNRLCSIYGLCIEFQSNGVQDVSSAVIGEKLGSTAETVRKDISFLGEAGRSGAGYRVTVLRDLIADKLGFNRIRTVCIVGLGKLGGAILEYHQLLLNGYRLVAGFDANSNRLETIRTQVRLFPAYQIAEIVKRESIEIAVLTVPADAAQGCSDALAEGGVKGVLNFTPVVLKPAGPDLVIRNVDILNEFRVLSSLLTLNGK